VYLEGPPDTAYAGGVFQLELQFPSAYPMVPPTLRFVSDFWHPNVYEVGKVCISILHAPGPDALSGELAAERWMPTQTPQTIILSVMSMLSDPNFSSPANVDASVMMRNDPATYRARCRALAQLANRQLPPGIVIPHPDSDPVQRERELRKLKRDANIVEADDWLEQEWARADDDEVDARKESEQDDDVGDGGDEEVDEAAAPPAQSATAAPMARVNDDDPDSHVVVAAATTTTTASTVTSATPTVAAATATATASSPRLASSDGETLSETGTDTTSPRSVSKRLKVRRRSRRVRPAPQEASVAELIACFDATRSTTTTTTNSTAIKLPLLTSIAMPSVTPPLAPSAEAFDWYTLTPNPNAALLAARFQSAALDDYAVQNDAMFVESSELASPVEPATLGLFNGSGACWQFGDGAWETLDNDAPVPTDVRQLRVASLSLAVSDAVTAALALDALERAATNADVIAVHECSAAFVQLLFRAVFVRAAFFVVCDFARPVAGALRSAAFAADATRATVLLTRFRPSLCTVGELPRDPFASAAQRQSRRRALSVAFLVGGSDAPAGMTASQPLHKRRSLLLRTLTSSSSSTSALSNAAAPVAATPELLVLTSACLTQHSSGGVERIGELATLSSISRTVTGALATRLSSTAAPPPLRKERLSQRLSRRLSMTASAPANIANAPPTAAAAVAAAAAPEHSVQRATVCTELLLVDVGNGERDGVLVSEFESAAALDVQRTRLLRRRASVLSMWQASDGALLSDSLADTLTRDSKPLAPSLQPFVSENGFAADLFIASAMVQVDESRLTHPTAEGARWLVSRK
jgi:ubiquitin-conjugating enzyme E2 R